MERPPGFYRPSFLEQAASVFASSQSNGHAPAQQPEPRLPKDLTKMLAPPPACPKQAAPACSSGPKACAQCGTTRTPQWREGPEGPKTLCNACGVKRVRAMRTQSEGSKRRPAKSPAALFKQASADLGGHADEAYDSRESGHKRPLRRAAARSAAKTADLASRSQWEGAEEQEFSYHSSQATSSADSAGHNSDSAEEVAWVPERHGSPRHVPPSPMARAVGPECAAAVNLLSMSCSELPLPQTLRPAPAPAPPQPAASAAKQLPRINASSFAQMANAALKWNCGAPATAAAQEALGDALRRLPPQQHAAMLAAKRDLDAISREAAAADAAVAAVAKILAMKQVAAIRARSAAAAAAKRVQKVMQGLDEEHGWSRQAAAKRPRA